MNSFKTYILNGTEFFESEIDGTICKSSFPFGKSLLDLLYLDLSDFSDDFLKIAWLFQFLIGEFNNVYSDEFLRLLNFFASKHIYFEFMRAALPEKVFSKENDYYKNIQRIHEKIYLIQIQITPLITEVLDVLSEQIPVQEKLKKHLDKSNYEFRELTLKFEKVDEDSFVEVLYPNTIYDIIDYYLRECIKREVRFKKCKCCGKYFILNAYTHTEYCDRPFDDFGHTCKEIGALNIWNKKQNENPELKLYAKEYKRRFAWIKYGKTSKELFYIWSEKARKKRDDCLANKISLEEFKEWLQNS